jgi:hypothetical protein
MLEKLKITIDEGENARDSEPSKPPNSMESGLDFLL